MASRDISFVTLDVFTDQRFCGNQLAVVDIRETELSQEDKLKLAREFNFSETVFLRGHSSDGAWKIDIFTPVSEMEFAGHPVIGTGHYLFRLLNAGTSENGQQRNLILSTKAGQVSLQYNPQTEYVTAAIPHNVHLHQKGVPWDRILDTQPHIRLLQPKGANRSHPAVSIVKGVSFAFVDLTDDEVTFSLLKAGPSPALDLDDGWSPSFTGVMYYRRLGLSESDGSSTEKLQVRMIAIGLEDPATGSAASALGAYLALQRGKPNHSYNYLIDQGAEIGRKSRIQLEVKMGSQEGSITDIHLAGPAAFTTRGTLFGL